MPFSLCGNAEERLDCLSEPTIGADILNWPVREDFVVDCRRELVLQVALIFVSLSNNLISFLKLLCIRIKIELIFNSDKLHEIGESLYKYHAIFYFVILFLNNFIDKSY